MLGPTHLENYIKTTTTNQASQKKYEWCRWLCSKSGNTKFKIMYFGDLHNNYNSLIVSTEFAPQKIVAIDTETNEEILLFDGCSMGYNAMLCDVYTKEQIESRSTDSEYQDRHGNNVFEIKISVYYQIDYEDEFKEYLNDEDQIELINGEWIDFETLKRNGFDGMQITAYNRNGVEIEILSEELA